MAKIKIKLGIIMNGLTAKQREILDYIKNYIEIHHYSPSLEEIKQNFSYSSLSTIHEHLAALNKKRYIQLEKGKRRSISIKESLSSSLTIPSFPIIGQFSSGLPLELFEKEQNFSTFQQTINSGYPIYTIRVHGNGLIDELIYNQDLLVIEARSFLNQGETGLISLKTGPAFIKKYFEEGNIIRLENLTQISYRNTEIFKKEEVVIRGKLISIIREFI